MKVCVEIKHSSREVHEHMYKNVTDVRLVYWPDGDIKFHWYVVGGMLSKYFEHPHYACCTCDGEATGFLPSLKKELNGRPVLAEERLEVRTMFYHEKIKCSPDHKAKLVENELRRTLKMAIRKQEQYIATHHHLLSHVTSLTSRLDQLQKDFSKHKSITGKRPHGTRVGEGRSTWIKLPQV